MSIRCKVSWVAKKTTEIVFWKLQMGISLTSSGPLPDGVDSWSTGARTNSAH